MLDFLLQCIFGRRCVVCGKKRAISNSTIENVCYDCNCWYMKMDYDGVFREACRKGEGGGWI